MRGCVLCVARHEGAMIYTYRLLFIDGFEANFTSNNVQLLGSGAVLILRGPRKDQRAVILYGIL